METGPVTSNKNHVEIEKKKKNPCFFFPVLFAVQSYLLTWGWATLEGSTKSKFLEISNRKQLKVSLLNRI